MPATIIYWQLDTGLSIIKYFYSDCLRQWKTGHKIRLQLYCFCFKL